jgi:SAM-dependent methyltransferase
LLEDPELTASDTSELYSDIWSETHEGRYRSRAGDADGGYRAPATSHLELLELASGWELVDGESGVDAGCGTGGSTIEMARRYPDVDFIGIDLSRGPTPLVGQARELGNVCFARGDLLKPPLAIDGIDFAYSFGVLHHTPDPELAFTRLVECVRPGGKLTLFLYKDFTDIPLKRFFLGFVTRIRRRTTRLSPQALGRLSRALAPLVYLKLTLPARLLDAVGGARIARHIPYSTFPSIAAVASSLQDRLGAPYEFRFSATDLEAWAERAGLTESRVIDCLPYGFSGLVLAGRKAMRVD